MEEINMNEKGKYITKIPTYKSYLENINDSNKEDYDEDKDEYDKTEFFRDWIDGSVDGLQWDIMSDSTSEDFNEDERSYCEDLETDELWLEVAENYRGQMLKVARNCIDEKEILARMPKNIKDYYDNLGKEIEKVRNVNKL